MAHVESRSEDVIKDRSDNNGAGKETADRSLDPQTYSRGKGRLTIFQVVEAQNPLHDVLQEHEDDVRESLQASKYEYDAGLMTAARLSSEKPCTVNLHSMSEHCVK